MARLGIVQGGGHNVALGTRKESIERYRKDPNVSVLIIGAGINGIGTFRDLALQGVDCLIIDKADFCSGASAASTRQAHGGLRYLENGEFRLVHESLIERNRLLRNAPHAVELQPFTIPLYTWTSGLLNAPLKFLGLMKKPSQRGYLVVKAGMIFYDWLTRRGQHREPDDVPVPGHAMLRRKEALKKHSGLNPNVIGAATYFDCRIPQAERIGVELVLDGELSCPDAYALNYCSIVDGSGDTVQLRDSLTGETFSVKPKLVINASGAWIDFVNRALNIKTHFIGGSKGSHIVVDHPILARSLAGSVLFFENTDNRLVIIVPFYDKVIIGTSDIRITDPDEAICTDAEIDYFLNFVSQVFPEVKVERSHIVFHFSGVRPLPASKTEFVGLVSRDHSIGIVPPNPSFSFPIYALIGGKWTTYRAFSERATDEALKFLGRGRSQFTRDTAIGGGAEYPRTPEALRQWTVEVKSRTGLSTERIDQLFRRYGTRAAAIAAYIVAGVDQPLIGQTDYSRREIMFLVQREKAEHLDDVVLRRSVLAMCGRVNGVLLRQLADIMGSVQGWTAEQTEQEIARTVNLLTLQHGVRQEILAGAIPIGNEIT